MSTRRLVGVDVSSPLEDAAKSDTPFYININYEGPPLYN